MEVLPPQIPNSPLEFYPYQKAWVDDPARRKIAGKSRRIGFSFADGFGCVLSSLEYPHYNIILSRGERQSKQFIAESVAPHCRAMGVISEYVTGYLPGSTIYKQEVAFANGSKIIALPANPDTARSYEGDVTLDEFGFHKDAAEIYRAVGPSITRGYKLRIISTPNGQQGSYYDLALEAGLVDGMPAKSDRFSKHRVTIFDAITMGFRDRFGNPINPDEVRLDCLDEDMWLQEYNCIFLSIFSQWISPALFQQNVDPNLTDVIFEIGAFPIESFRGRILYGGWDIARHRDLSVIWIFELLGDVLSTVAVIEMPKIPTPQQKQEARRLMPFLQRLVIDQSGMGLSIYEDLHSDFGPMVEGVTFTQQTKEGLAVGMKSIMEAVKARIPDTDMIRHSFRSVKKIVTATGMNRFDAEHDEKYGHADHWWAACLARSAWNNLGSMGLIEYLKRVHREQQQEMKKQLEPAPAEPKTDPETKIAVTTPTLVKPTTNPNTNACPNCGGVAIVRVAGQQRCNICGHQWGGNVGGSPAASRKDLFK